MLNQHIMINNMIMDNVTIDSTDIDNELIINKNAVGQPLLNNEASGQPIICGPPTKESKGDRPKNKVKVTILQMQQFHEFL